MENEFLPKIAMSIHAHPDDQEFTVAGTLARWARLGCEVISVIITSGDAGSNDSAHGMQYKSILAELREKEQLEANAILGIKETIFLRYPDGELEATIPLRRELTRLIRHYKPEVVVTGNMEAAFYSNDYINHPDHRAAAEAATYAVFPSAGSRLIFTDLLEAGFEPHNVKRLYVHGVEKPDTWVDISEDIHSKINALRKHVSQLNGWDPEQMMHEWSAEEGKAKEMSAAEAYRVMILVKDKEQV